MKKSKPETVYAIAKRKSWYLRFDAQTGHVWIAAPAHVRVPDNSPIERYIKAHYDELIPYLQRIGAVV